MRRDVDLHLKHALSRLVTQHPIDDLLDAGIRRAQAQIGDEDEFVQQVARVVVAVERRAGSFAQFTHQRLHPRMIEHGPTRGFHPPILHA